jgi:hypothetical protein
MMRGYDAQEIAALGAGVAVHGETPLSPTQGIPEAIKTLRIEAGEVK